VGGQRSWQKGNFTGIRILEKFGLEESFPISILQLLGCLAFFWSGQFAVVRVRVGVGAGLGRVMVGVGEVAA